VAVREVLLFPHPALKATAVELGQGDRAEAERVAADLVDTMRSYGHATGLAATQLGELVRVVAVDVSEHRKTTTSHGLLVLVNPGVVRAEGAEVAREGCLSIPHLTANVRRATVIAVEGASPAGEDVALETEGFEARCLLHEIDHLDGLLFLDRVDSVRSDVFARKRR
jgi:peptide deformylase